MRMRVDIDVALKAIENVRHVNKARITEVVFLRNGKEMEVSESDREDWLFTGLNLSDFIETREWK